MVALKVRRAPHVGLSRFRLFADSSDLPQSFEDLRDVKVLEATVPCLNKFESEVSDLWCG
ncbi:hypothetical protein AXX17_AT2G28900 [Arabidopsis thaliana]|uniref:Uncharacterized protein n=1 Tax=Arabidopsis thaliana TaxID=3702 RepID=A0A178VZ97_ARATH|nr:hypothetical protein AXX17_AT2G28900 [Arabidopsis thaliana]